MDIAAFRRTVYSHYSRHRRPMAWRNTRDPYRIIVSEIMLQQTQVPRVKEKYRQFIAAFPTLRALARAPLRAVLREWQGLGYNRRALYLKRLAQAVVRDYAGRIPSDRSVLEKLPGLGPATSASVCAFAFGQPHPFIETDIRSVFIHHFFGDRPSVSDAKIMPLVEASMDRDDPRNWYYALMDYGTHLKATMPKPSRKSLHYRRQPPLEGSVRQCRSKMLRRLTRGSCPRSLLLGLSSDRGTAERALASMVSDGLVRERGSSYRIA